MTARESKASQRIGDGLFAGVPLLVKDNVTIAGVQLTQGSRALRGNVPDKTAPFFVAAREAEFILVGVTNMPEMGLIDEMRSNLERSGSAKAPSVMGRLRSKLPLRSQHCEQELPLWINSSSSEMFC